MAQAYLNLGYGFFSQVHIGWFTRKKKDDELGCEHLRDVKGTLTSLTSFRDRLNLFEAYY